MKILFPLGAVTMFASLALAAVVALVTSYSVTGTTYVTLQAHSGCTTYASTTVSASGGSGGGAVVSATACGKDVSDCVSGTVGGSSGTVLVNVTSKECEKLMRGCGKIRVVLRNGDVFEIDVPGFLKVAVVDLMGGAEVSPGQFLFPLSVDQALPVAPGSGHGGTIGSLPPASASAPYDGPVHVSIETSGSGPFATLVLPGHATGLLETDVDFSRGHAFLGVDTSSVSAGARVTIRTSGVGLDKGATSFVVR